MGYKRTSIWRSNLLSAIAEAGDPLLCCGAGELKEHHKAWPWCLRYRTPRLVEHQME